MPTVALKQRLDAWRNDGPIRQWRARHRLSLHDAAALCDISLSTLQVLEAGSREPNDSMLDRLANGMSVAPSTLRRQFRAWVDQRPF